MLISLSLTGFMLVKIFTSCFLLLWKSLFESAARLCLKHPSCCHSMLIFRCRRDFASLVALVDTRLIAGLDTRVCTNFIVHSSRIHSLFVFKKKIVCGIKFLPRWDLNPAQLQGWIDLIGENIVDRFEGTGIFLYTRIVQNTFVNQFHCTCSWLLVFCLWWWLI